MFDDFKWAMFSSELFYSCEVTSSNIMNRGSAVFKGVHKAKKTNDSVKGLKFNNTKVHYVPGNLTQIFPNLIFLQIRDCELKEVAVDDMVGLEKLVLLFLDNNIISTLPVDLFKNMKNLRLISVGLNLLQELDAKILEPIKNTIEYFNLVANPGMSVVFDKKRGIDIFSHQLKNFELYGVKSKRFDNMLTSGKHSDFTIKVQDKEFKVHKCLLASLSTVFDKMFTDDEAATSRTYENIRNFSQGAIAEFVRYFYTRNYPTKTNVIDLLELSIEFNVDELKQQCEHVLRCTVTPESARRLYNIAVKYSFKFLKAFEKIQECNPEIPDYVYDKPELLNQVIDAKDEARVKGIKLEKDE